MISERLYAILPQLISSVSFSALHPKSSITPHFGEINWELRCQMPLLNFEDSTITVGGNQQGYFADQLVLFDDTFLHSVENRGDRTRIALLFDFFHPDFTSNEISLLKMFLKDYSATFLTSSSLEQQNLAFFALPEHVSK